MKLLLTPELFILQDSSQLQITSQDEEKKENRNFNEIDSECRLKHANRTKRFIDTPEFHLLNSQNNQNQGDFNQLNQKQEVTQTLPLEPNIRIVEKNGKIIYDKRFVTKRKPKREIIQSDIRCVNLNKEKFGGSFGITIKGGLEFNKPLIISNIQRSSAADKCKSLFLGDLIVELNGHVTYPIRLTHEQAMKLIKSGGNKLYLTVKHLTMYNRPISRCWQRQINMNWLNNNDSKLDEEWLVHQTSQKSAINSSINSSLNSAQIKDDKSSLQESFMQPPTTIESNQNQDHRTKCEQLGNSCERSNFSNLTVTITPTDKTDSQTPSPLNDEGVYTGLSNDALSSSSDATSCFSSDYIQSSSQNSNQQTNLNHNQNSNHSHHHCNKASSLSKHEFNFVNHKQVNYNESLIENRTNCLSTTCSSLDCKNRKNNNCCTKCIVNKNHQNLNYLNHVNELESNDLKQRHAIDCRNLISQEDSLHLEPVDQDFNFNKENSLNFQNFSFRSTDCADNLQTTLKHSSDCKKAYDSTLDNVDALEHFQRTIANGKQQRIVNSEKISNECCSCRSSSTTTTKTSSSNRSSNNLVDIVSVNLINCYFTKYINNTDNIRRNGMEVRWFDLHNQKLKKTKQTSPVEVNSAIINFNDNELALQFQNKINDYLSKLNESYMFTFNRGLKANQRILFCGWISLAIPKAKDLSLESIKNQQASKSLDYNWQPKYMIIKGGELSLYDYVPDYLLDKIQYANDTLMEFNELSNLLINKNGNLACSITMMNKLNYVSKQTPNTQLNGRQANRSKSLTRHLSIRGQDSSINLERYRSNNNGDKSILTEANNSLNKKTGNRLVCSLTRNLSLKTAKENRYSNAGRQSINSKMQRTTNLHCTLPRNQVHLAGDQTATSQQFTLDRKQNLKRATAASNLFTPNEYLLNQTNDDGMISQQTEFKYQNKPIVFKAYQSVLRELKENEQLDRRENCLLALTTQADNSIDLSNAFRKQSTINHSTGDKNAWLDNDQIGKNGLDHYSNNDNSSRSSKSKSSPSLVAYLAVEHADNIAQILKSWNVATMHSVVALSKKSFTVMSEGSYGCLTLDWNTGFTLYDSASNVKWSFKFSQLKNSSDDGSNTLWLSFQSIKHQPVAQIRPQTNTFSNQSDNNSSLNSSMDSVDQYSQRSNTLNRALTPCSFDSGNMNEMSSSMNTMRSNNQLNGDYLINNGNYLKTNRNEFKIKKSIETKELTCANLQHLIYCMHSFLAAKVTNVSSMPNQQFLNGFNNLV